MGGKRIRAERKKGMNTAGHMSISSESGGRKRGKTRIGNEYKLKK